MLSQRMELDLLEFAADTTPILASAGPSLILDVSGNFGPINLILGDKNSVANAADNSTPAVSREIEQALYNAFDLLASRIEAIQLKSNLDQLKDSSANTSEKNSAAQRIRGFRTKPLPKLAMRPTQGTKAMLDYITSLAGYMTASYRRSRQIMPKRTNISSILIGAGPIVIGQACEFDYSGAQACKALKSEGYRVVLVNSNSATRALTTAQTRRRGASISIDFSRRISGAV